MLRGIGSELPTIPSDLFRQQRFLKPAMVIEGRFGEAGGAELDLWLHKAEVEIVAVTAEHADQARRAWRRFGRGRHPAGLNYGDGFAYALARLTDEPLLFKGDDFSRTDIRSVWDGNERWSVSQLG